MKKYKLLKDLPDLKAGSIIEKFEVDYKPEDLPDFFEPVNEWPKSVDEIHNAKLKNYSTYSVLAYQKLLLLAAEMNGDWIPDWSDNNFKYTVCCLCKQIAIDSFLNIKYNIAFKTREAAEFSLEHHRELWEQYYMI